MSFEMSLITVVTFKYKMLYQTYCIISARPPWILNHFSHLIRGALALRLCVHLCCAKDALVMYGTWKEIPIKPPLTHQYYFILLKPFFLK